MLYNKDGFDMKQPTNIDVVLKKNVTSYDNSWEWQKIHHSFFYFFRFFFFWFHINQ